MNMGLLEINTLDKSSVLGNTATIIQRPTYVSHWSAPDHVFGEDTSVVISVAKSDHDSNYKTDFEILREIRNLSAQSIR